MKTIKVVAAIICSSLGKKERVLATTRGYGDYKGMWEFPGGKIEAGETPQQALVREIKEELDVDITVGELLHIIEYDYPNFHLSMDCFWSEIRAGILVAKEAQEMRWLSAHELNDVLWLPADLELIPKIHNSMYNQQQITLE